MEALEIGGFRNVVNTAPANPITTDDPLRPADGWLEQAGGALSFNALVPEAAVDFDPTEIIASDSFFDRLAARLTSVVGSISRSLSNVASGSQGSQGTTGTRLPADLLLSNHSPARDDELGGAPINPSQPAAATESVLTAMIGRLSLSGSAGTQSTAEYVGSSSPSGLFDSANLPSGIPLGSRFIEAYPLVYTTNGVAPPPPGFIPGRMIPDPLPLRKYYLSCNLILCHASF